jgi:anti-sigma regulatory factor (Ser/Thr protein kinase)
LNELALHLLDIAENGVTAQAKTVQVIVEEDTRTDRLKLAVIDDGVGMPPEKVAKLADPFVTSRTTRKVGLGIPLLKAAAEACNGWLEVQSTPGKGTSLSAEFQRSHIDRMPLGDITGTVLSLVVGWPETHWIFRYRLNDAEFLFDDQPIKDELGDLPLCEPEILAFLRQTLEEGVAGLKQAI